MALQVTLGLEDIASIVTITSPLVTVLFLAVDWMIKRRIAELKAGEIAELRERLSRAETRLDEQQRRLDKLEKRVDELVRHVYRLRERAGGEAGADPLDPPTGEGGRRKDKRALLREIASSLMGAVSLTFVIMNLLIITSLTITALEQGLGSTAAKLFYTAYAALALVGILAGIRAASLAYKYRFREALPYLAVDALPLILLYTLLLLQKG